MEIASRTGFFGEWIQIQSKWHGSANLVGCIDDTADHKKFDLKVEYLREFESIYKTALTWRSGAKKELIDGKKLEVENLVTGSL
jgi:hypothetical protein